MSACVYTNWAVSEGVLKRPKVAKLEAIGSHPTGAEN